MKATTAFLTRPVRAKRRRELGCAPIARSEFSARLLKRIRATYKHLEAERARLLRLGRHGDVAARLELQQRYRLVFVEADAYEVPLHNGDKQVLPAPATL